MCQHQTFLSYSTPSLPFPKMPSATAATNTRKTTDLKSPVKNDGSKDMRYASKQFCNKDGKRDMRTKLTAAR